LRDIIIPKRIPTGIFKDLGGHMHHFSKIAALSMGIAATFLVSHVNATCARCVQIEKARAEEQAKNGPQPAQYYEDTHKTDISYVNVETTTDSTRLSPTGTTTNSTGLSGSATSNTGLNGSASNLPGGTASANTSMPTNSSTNAERTTDRSSGATGTSTDSNGRANNPTTSSKTTSTSTTSTQINNNPSSSPKEQSVSHTTTNVKTETINKTAFLTTGPNYSTIAAILQTPDFVKTLNGPYTLFVPSNAALLSLPRSLLFQDLANPENKAKLTNLVSNHLVAQKITDLSQSSVIKAINGKEIYVRLDQGLLLVNGAHVLKSENIDSNGVIYIIDAVLAP
jgi:uncharacterized surface protein with fasciclin (FAS1) repeats